MSYDIELNRDEWESYVQAKMLQAKLDGTTFSIFCKENFGGDYGHRIKEVFEAVQEEGWMEYIGDAEYLTGTHPLYKTDMGVLLEYTGNRRTAVNCHPMSHLDTLRNNDSFDAK